MNQIEVFVDSIYKNARGNRKEIQELKTEIKSHLLEAVHELIAEGKSQEEAIDIAIQRFGGEKEMGAIVRQLFEAQIIFAKRVFYIAIAFLIVSLAASGLVWKVEKGNRAENTAFANTVYEVLGNQSANLDEIDTIIKALVLDTVQITNVQVYRMNDVETVTEDGSVSYFNHHAIPMYQYVREIRPSSVMDFYYATGDEWFIHVESKNLATLVGYLLTAGIAVYAVLFTIWASINAYHHRRLNMGWILVFALLNVLGYLLYRMVEKQKGQQKISG